MNKVLKRLFIGLILLTLAFSFTACMGRTANTTPAYVNTYYVGGEKSDTKFIAVLADGTWRYENGNVVKIGGYKKVSDIELAFCYSDGTAAGIRGDLEENVWTITDTGSTEKFVKQAASSGCQSGNVSTYVIFGILILAIIGLFIWSSISKKKQTQKAQETVSKLKVGDKVKTIGGICGYVAEIDDTENTFVLEVKTEKESSFIKFDKGAIYQTAPAGSGAEEKPATEKTEDKGDKESK